MKSFGSQESQAKLLLKQLRDRNEPEAEGLEQIINHAKSANFHNLALALKLWEEILMGGFNDGVLDVIESPGTKDKSTIYDVSGL